MIVIIQFIRLVSFKVARVIKMHIYTVFDGEVTQPIQTIRLTIKKPISAQGQFSYNPSPERS
jgi:hypothetical protein